MSEPLKLRAEDAEDLAVVSACLQDSLVPLSDVEYLPDDKRFVLVANRFRWENCQETADSPVVDPPTDPNFDVAFAPNCTIYERVNCGVCFEGVERVRQRGFDQRDRSRVLELLAIETDSGGVRIAFAGDAEIQLEGAKVWCHLTDFGDPWPTQWRPRHPGDDAL